MSLFRVCFRIQWIIEKARQLQKNIYFCFIDYAKAFDYVDHHKLLKIPGKKKKLENSSRWEYQTPDLPLETSVWSGSNC